MTSPSKRKLESRPIDAVYPKVFKTYPEIIPGFMKRLGSKSQQLNILKQKIVGNRYESYETELAIMEGGHSR